MKIGGGAFRECTEIEEIVLPDGITEIGSGAFSRCIKLRKINMPKSLKILGSGDYDPCDDWYASWYGTVGVFAGCDMKEIKLPSSLEIIGEYAFSYCPFETVVLPDSVKTIEANAFYEADAIKSLTVPKSVEFIGEGNFGTVDRYYTVDLETVYYLGTRQEFWDKLGDPESYFGDTNAVMVYAE